MQVTVEVPKAFSARGENEFVPIQHLMTRLNPQLVVKQVATAVHVDGGGTVYGALCAWKGSHSPRRMLKPPCGKRGSTSNTVTWHRQPICPPAFLGRAVSTTAACVRGKASIDVSEHHARFGPEDQRRSQAIESDRS